MCICDRLPKTKIRLRSVRKIYPNTPSLEISRREFVDGRTVALVRGVEADGYAWCKLVCAGDVVWRRQQSKSAAGDIRSHRVVHDTFKCPRKNAFAQQVRKEMAERFTPHKHAPKHVILLLHSLVRDGMYVGHSSGWALYAQHVADIFQHMYPETYGIPNAASYIEDKMMRRRSIEESRSILLYLDIPIEKYCRTRDSENDEWSELLPLSDNDIKNAAFLEDTLWLISELTTEHKIRLNGMILMDPSPRKVDTQNNCS